jgi:hypothetical protein
MMVLPYLNCQHIIEQWMGVLIQKLKEEEDDITVSLGVFAGRINRVKEIIFPRLVELLLIGDKNSLNSLLTLLQQMPDEMFAEFVNLQSTHESPTSPVMTPMK